MGGGRLSASRDMDPDENEGSEYPAVQPDWSLVEDSEDETPEHEDEDDPIGVVRPGERDDLAFMVVRNLGYGDTGDYSGAPVEKVMRLQEEAGLTPDGIVRGQTWALVLRCGPVASLSGHEAWVVRSLLGLPALATVADVREALAAFTESGDVTRDIWWGLIDVDAFVKEN